MIAASDWIVLVVFVLFIIFLMLVVEEVSALLNILAAFIMLIAASVLDQFVFAGNANDFVRYGTFLVFVTLAILSFTRGALRLPEEVSP